MRYTNPKSQIKNRESKMRAFTLIEMLISLAIMAVIAAALG